MRACRNERDRRGACERDAVRTRHNERDCRAVSARSAARECDSGHACYSCVVSDNEHAARSCSFSKNDCTAGQQSRHDLNVWTNYYAPNGWQNSYNCQVTHGRVLPLISERPDQGGDTMITSGWLKRFAEKLLTTRTVNLRGGGNLGEGPLSQCSKRSISKTAA